LLESVQSRGPARRRDSCTANIEVGGDSNEPRKVSHLTDHNQ
jgi:hypothetical protein